MQRVAAALDTASLPTSLTETRKESNTFSLSNERKGASERRESLQSVGEGVQLLVAKRNDNPLFPTDFCLEEWWSPALSLPPSHPLASPGASHSLFPSL